MPSSAVTASTTMAMITSARTSRRSNHWDPRPLGPASAAPGPGLSGAPTNACVVSLRRTSARLWPATAIRSRNAATLGHQQAPKGGMPQGLEAPDLLPALHHPGHHDHDHGRERDRREAGHPPAAPLGPWQQIAPEQDQAAEPDRGRREMDDPNDSANRGVGPGGGVASQRRGDGQAGRRHSDRQPGAPWRPLGLPLGPDQQGGEDQEWEDAERPGAAEARADGVLEQQPPVQRQDGRAVPWRTARTAAARAKVPSGVAHHASSSSRQARPLRPLVQPPGWRRQPRNGNKACHAEQHTSRPVATTSRSNAMRAPLTRIPPSGATSVTAASRVTGAGSFRRPSQWSRQPGSHRL